MLSLLTSLVLQTCPELIPSPVGAPDWPQWRGPTRDGACAGLRWPDGLGAERLTLRWRVELGKGYAGPIVASDRVFTVETVAEERELVRAFDRATGAELWATGWEGSMQVPFFAARNGSWVRSTPAWDGEHLYVGGMRDHLVCIEGGTGAVRWSVSFPERHEAPLPAFGLVCSPLVWGDDLYVQAGGALEKLDKRIGETVWRTLDDGGGMESAFSSPVLAELHGERQLLVSTRAALCGVDPEDGAVLWEAPIRSFRGMNVLTPTPVGDAVFTSAYGGRSQLLSPVRDEDGWVVETAWEARPRGYMTSPVVIDGHAYLYLQSNRFTCVRLSDGEVAWISEPMGDEYWSLVVQGDRILALTDGGELLLIQADPAGYRELARVTASDQETWGHLAVSGRELFVRELEGLAVFTWE